MSLTRISVLLLIGIFVTLILIQSLWVVQIADAKAFSTTQVAITIKIAPEKPFDLPPLADRQEHTLTEASIFAWQQFIAHTWPAKPQTGAMNTRDEPDTSKRYGQKGSTGQVVWADLPS